jgi:hypothetical protein
MKIADTTPSAVANPDGGWMKDVSYLTADGA